MGRGGLLIVALVVSFLTGCGTRAPASTGDQSGVAGRVHLGPQCPVETETDPCQDKPAAHSRVTVTKQAIGTSGARGKVVARATTDSDGRYRVAVPPGTYMVTADAGMSCELMTTRVGSDAYSRVDIRCDTGIR
jgi:Carboxypeptidase regulatory-like domain